MEQSTSLPSLASGVPTDYAEQSKDAKEQDSTFCNLFFIR